MGRTWRVTFEFLNEHGWWMPDYLDGNGCGFLFREADMLKADLEKRENTRNVRIEPMSAIRHW